MPAPFKRTRTKEISKIAEEVITAVKKELKNKKRRHKRSKGRSVPLWSWGKTIRFLFAK